MLTRVKLKWRGQVISQVMSNEIQRHYLERTGQLRYLKGEKKQKTLIRDEICKVCEVSRKHAIKLLHEAELIH